MLRVIHPYADPNANGVGKAGFTDGEDGISPSTPAPAVWLNALQEEIVNVLERRGLTLSSSLQLRDAMWRAGLPSSPIAATLNTYLPVGADDIHVLVSGSGDLDIPGFTNPENGKIIYVQNTDATLALSFVHDAAGTPSQSILLPNSAPKAWIEPRQVIPFIYDGSSARWRPIAPVRLEKTYDATLSVGTTHNLVVPAYTEAIWLDNSTGGVATITGIAAPGPVYAREITLHNVSETQNLLIVDEDAGSSEANRFHLPGATSATAEPREALRIRYRVSNSRWYLIDNE